MIRQKIQNLRRYIGIYLFTAMLVGLAANASLADDSDQKTPESVASASVWSTPITLFQKTISKADGSRCPMYPSCSHYSRQAFERHNPITAWILTCDRLLRCGRDETRRTRGVYVKGQMKTKDSLRDNTFWWRTP